MQLTIHEKAFIASVFTQGLVFNSSLSFYQINYHAIMTFDNELQKKIWAQMRSANNGYSLSRFKKLFLGAYGALWHQTDPCTREKIANYFAKVVCERFNVTDPIKYPHLESFFSNSLLHVKSLSNKDATHKIFQRLYVDAQMAKASTKVSIWRYLERPTEQCFQTVFTQNDLSRAAAEKISKRNFKELKEWVDAYPREFFHSEQEASQESKRLSGRQQKLGSMILSIYMTLACTGNENAISNTVKISLGMLGLWLTYFALMSSAYEEDSIMKNIHFKLINKESKTRVKTSHPSREKSFELFEHPRLTLEVQAQSSDTSDISDTESDDDISASPVAKKQKIKTRPMVPSLVTVELLEEKTQLPAIAPGYFGGNYQNLDPCYMVSIDRNHAGRRNSYFAIWLKNSIESDVKNQVDETNRDELFKVFQEGKMASKTNTNGIKRLSNLGFFEIKKVCIPARIFGQREVTHEGKKAIIFENYSRNGLHS